MKTPIKMVDAHTKKIIEPTQKQVQKTRLALEQHACRLAMAIFGGAIVAGEWIEDYDLMMG